MLLQDCPCEATIVHKKFVPTGKKEVNMNATLMEINEVASPPM